MSIEHADFEGVERLAAVTGGEVGELLEDVGLNEGRFFIMDDCRQPSEAVSDMTITPLFS